MKIHKICTIEVDGWACLSAQIDWENSDNESGEFFFRVPREHGDKLGNAADAFFCAGLIPAFSNGEERIWVEDPVCPVLLENAEEALFWIRAWQPEKYRNRALTLDCERREVSTAPQPYSALFLSGGVDASYSMYRNHLAYPDSHPARARFGITIYGFDIGGKKAEAGSESSLRAFERTRASIERVCGDYGLESIVVFTNIRHLDDTSGFWGHEFVGAALSSCAHALGGGAGLFYLSSAGEPLSATGNPAHFGTHPLLDPCYSSYSVRIKHYLVSHDSRLKRLLCLSQAPKIFDSIRVCYNTPSDKLNCGKCEKCVRTKLMLDVLGKLDQCQAFESNKIDPEDLDNVCIASDSVEQMYRELLSISRERKYVHTRRIECMLSKYEKFKAWKNETGWKGKIKQLDRRYFKGFMSRMLSLHG